MSRTAVPVPIAVLAGSRSPEHEVSISSARQLVRALDRGRWMPYLVRLDATTPTWWLRREPVTLDEADPFAEDAATWSPLHPGIALATLQDQLAVEIVFPVLHGPYGEDGTVQGMLQLAAMPFVGSGVAASAVCIDKLRTRECLEAADVPMARAHIGRDRIADIDVAREVETIAATIGFPCFAKLDTSGSSLGVARIEDPEALTAFFREHRSSAGRRYVIEAQVSGEEISVPVLGNSGEPLEPLPPIGIYPRTHAHFSYEAKYRPGGSDEVVPPRGLDAVRIADVQRLAVRCHEALQCDGMSRTDMIVTQDGPIVLEVNTIPGMTPGSLLPQCAAHHGIPFSALLDRLLDAGLRRWGRG